RGGQPRPRRRAFGPASRTGSAPSAAGIIEGIAMTVRAEEIASILKEQIENFDATATQTNVGTVIEAGDGIARIHGLGECLTSELVEFSVQDDEGRPIRGLALNLEE